MGAVHSFRHHRPSTKELTDDELQKHDNLKSYQHIMDGNVGNAPALAGLGKRKGTHRWR